MPAYQPKTGERCHCRPGLQRDNCPDCEGTGWRIDFAAIRNRRLNAASAETKNHRYNDEGEVRTAFWETQPALIRALHEGKRQNQCPADVRAAFVDFVDYLQKDGQITEELADEVTL